MRNLKRVLSLALALVMVLGMMVITTSAADFSDAEEVTYTEAVEVMSALGILKGYPDGSFKPAGTLTRAEAAKIVAYVCLGADAESYLTGSAAAFEDVAVDNWAAKYVAFCKNAAIINGVNEAQTLFNPNGTLTTVQFAKMLLGALGIEGQFTGEGWENNVKKASKNILDGVVIDNSVITREEACELALDAMKVGEETVTYVVTMADGTKKEFEDYDTAKLVYAVKDAAVDFDVNTTVSGSMLEVVYGVTYTAKTTDAFGRAIATYTNAKTKLNLAFAREEAVKVFESTGKVADALKGFTVASKKLSDKVAIEDIVVVNGAAAADLVPAAGKTVADAIQALITDTTIVEIYATNDNITKIVVVEYTYDEVVDVIEAKGAQKAAVKFAKAGTVEELTGFEKGDYVMYAAVAGKLENLAKLSVFSGVLTSYTKDGAYTIGEDTYLVEGGLDLTGYLMAKDIWYVLGNTGKIIDAYVDAGDGKAEDVITNYVKITASLGKVTTAKDEWTGAESITGASAKVKGILSDGTVGEFDLVVEKDKDGFFVKVNGAKVYVVKGDLDINGYYTYKMTEAGIVLVSDKVPAFVNQTKIEKSTVAIDKNYLIDADTTFILFSVDANGKQVVTTAKGSAALADVYAVAGDAVVFYEIVYTTDKDGNKVESARLADVVYANVQKVAASGPKTDKNAIVYIDGNFSVSVVDKKVVYTYEGIKLDGTKVTLTYGSELAAGVYMYNEKNVVDVESAHGAQADKVATIIGSSLKLESAGYINVKDGVEPVVIGNAKWEAGADIFYFVDKGVVVGIFVV